MHAKRGAAPSRLYIPLAVDDFGRRYPRDVYRNYDATSGRGPKISRARAIAAERYFSPPLQNHLLTPLFIANVYSIANNAGVPTYD